MTNKSKKLLCIFAHPDDEAFGPGGTLAKLSQTHQIHLICVTNGNDPQKSEDLTQTRQQELQRSAEILGISKVKHFNYEDGSLSSGIYHELAGKLQQYINQFQPESLLTFEPLGVSGHLDHIALCMITTYVFTQNPSIKNLWYYCELKSLTDAIDDYFIYFPPGYTPKAINKTVDISETYKTKVKAMKAHKSQQKDVDWILKLMKNPPKEENFIVLDHQSLNRPRKLFSP